MLGSIRTGVAAGIAVLFGIAGMFYALVGAAETRAGQASVVEFTPDGKMKRPEGYREWIYIGTRRSTPRHQHGADPHAIRRPHRLQPMLLLRG